jgi:hypothetical protein
VIPQPTTPAPDAVPSELSVATIQQYVWARYVEFEQAPFEVDEEAALALFRSHYASHPLEQDSECFYFGILAYERSFADPEHQLERLREAVHAFEAYRGQTSVDFTWDAVEDRYLDAVEALKAPK